eukprot:11224931-Karenia_brevis.AAC.1
MPNLTSGPGRKIRWMTADVISGSFLTNSAWLQTGFEIWKLEPFCYECDYLVTLLGENLEMVHRMKARYFDMVRFARAVLGLLRLPEICDDRLGNNAN